MKRLFLPRILLDVVGLRNQPYYGQAAAEKSQIECDFGPDNLGAHFAIIE